MSSLDDVKVHTAHGRPSLGRSLAVIYFVIVLYAAAFMSQQPVQQYHVHTLGGESASSYLFLRSFFSCAQFLGSLVFGSLVDRFGARTALMLSFSAGAASYLLTASASSLVMLFLAQVPTVFLHAMLAARAFVTSCVPEEERAVALGRLIVAYGVGMVVGPAIGGHLAASSLTLAALGAAFLSLLSLACVAWLLPAPPPTALLGASAPPPPSSAQPPAPADGSSGSSGSGSDPIVGPEGGAGGGGYRALLALPGVPAALLVKLLFFASTQMFQAALLVVAEERFQMDSAALGEVLSFVGAASVLASLLLVPAVSALPFSTVLAWSSLGTGFSLFLFSHATSRAEVYAWVLPQAALGSLFSTVHNAAISKFAPPRLQGSLNAADMALRAACSILAPPMVAWLLSVGPPMVAGSQAPAALMIAAAGLLHLGIGVPPGRVGS